MSIRNAIEPVPAAHDLVRDFAAFAAGARYEDVPAPARETAKKSILDTLGVIVAASGADARVGAFVDIACEAGGAPESTVLGFGRRVPALQAAFANGVLAHRLDFDDRTPWGAHADSSVVPAALALAERAGGIRGAELITAVAVAQDLFVRLRCNVGWRKDWNLSSVVGVFSAAAAAARVLGLDRDQTAHALGIASMQSAGTMELIFGTGGDLRGAYAGFTAQGAVLAALLAQKGITGISSLFEGKAGVFSVYFGGAYGRDAMLQDLGTDYRGAAMLYKPWPTVGIAHTYIHATIEAMQAHALRPSEIEQIRVSVGDFQLRMCTPLAERRSPRAAVDAKFSLPFCIAIAAVRGDVRISDFAPAALRDPAVLAMAQRVVPVPDDSVDWTHESPEGRIEIVTRDGRSLVRVGNQVPGSPEAPLDWDRIARKFADCVSCAAIPIATERVAAAVAMARDLERLDDATDLIRAIA